MLGGKCWRPVFACLRWLSIDVFLSIRCKKAAVTYLIYLGACHLARRLADDSSHGEKCLCALLSPAVAAQWHRRLGLPTKKTRAHPPGIKATCVLQAMPPLWVNSVLQQLAAHSAMGDRCSVAAFSSWQPTAQWAIDALKGPSVAACAHELQRQ